MCESLSGNLTCRSVNKKVYIILEKFLLILHSFAEKPPIDGFARNFAYAGHLADIITYFKFCINRFRGFGTTRGRILPFTIDLASRC